MAEQDIRQANFNTTNFFFFLYKWRKPLIIICLVAAIVSSVISLLITPKYKSSVILFPASTNAISKALLADRGCDADWLRDALATRRSLSLIHISEPTRPY